MKLYVIIADGTFDQVCEGDSALNREKRDLKKMGCTVKVKPVSSWDEANRIEAKMRGY